MMVIAWMTAVTTWPMDSHRPAMTNQMTLEMPDIPPVPLRGSTTERPNGHSANWPMRNEATPAGIVTMKMQAMMPKRK